MTNGKRRYAVILAKAIQDNLAMTGGVKGSATVHICDRCKSFGSATPAKHCFLATHGDHAPSRGFCDNFELAPAFEPMFRVELAFAARETGRQAA